VAVLPHDASVIVATFSPDGKWIITRTERKVISVWEAGTARRVSAIDASPRELLGFAVSPNGNCLVTVSVDEPKADVWETATGARVAELTGHKAALRSPAFSADGRRIVIADLDGQVDLYSFGLGGGSEDLVAAARTRVSRRLSDQERQRYLPAAYPP
jgi:WD40 repeat protein